ncbi:HTTM domain-containing protein [Halorussus amylolyticus]|uniref:HTTM domain-containing protein n=1 Tax=Halorussus amylolyticus TaxID=1126242 RepID=UPI00104C4B25|nr:HTTM domain-containing protein [Halorussus amylolyticus]
MNGPSTPDSSSGRLAALADRLSAGVARRFEVDYRALAAFRIAVGGLVVADLLLRSRDLVAFYTDAGVLPRRALFADYSGAYSFHALSGEAWVQVVLFALAGGFAFALVVGYRTRTATVASWLLLVSLHIRNPMVLNSGDTLLRMLLLWSIFLPLDERWSVAALRNGGERSDDSADAGRDRAPVASVATAALLVQVVLMYVTNAIHKFRGEAWVDGEALVYIFSADHFTILLGNVLAEYHALLEVASYLWLGLIVVSPLLLVLTGIPRAVLATVFVGMHLGMLVTLRIDLFPLVVVAGLLAFYPPAVWDAVARLAARLAPADRDVLDALARWASVLPSTSARDSASALVRAPTLPRGSTVGGVASRGRAACFALIPYVLLALVVMSNAEAVDYTEAPDIAESALDTVQADQSWQMFAPYPTRSTRWFAAPADLESGERIDAFDGSAVDLDRPERVERTYPTSRWRKYLSNVRSADNRNHRSYLGRYLCDRWNRHHDDDIESVTIHYLYEVSDPYEGTTSDGKRTLIEYECGGEFVQDPA